ncbi:hypothetical protein K461DRAFT_292827 [Myriangium duriaei CBS 260.36]|uniref:C3H1-type domain-containing protein n=1 Tax=Myriangium duriaei CBS 260.36 TaxID=1168546 RepID=A0A9P4J643_9PEZI|nr:hypothetical protein K461DRAFT_292827 [Myriangium duriaei CBS 260.36]
MQLSDETISLLRPYIVKQLESVSEADNEVLADYVLELIKSEGDEAAVEKNAKEQLSEFLEGGDVFVDQVFHAIRTKAYDPNATQPIPSVIAPRSATGENAQNGGGSRKRSFREDEDTAMQDVGARGGRDNRPMKAARRGRGDHLHGRGGRGGGRGGFQQQQQMPMGMPGFNFDPSDPMAAFMAMQQALANGGMPFQQQPQQHKKTGKRCRDYDNKGVCMRGASCPYDHGTDYETTYEAPQTGDQHYARGRGRGRGDRGRTSRGGRADFSSAGPSHDRNNTSVVVENIPAESFSEDVVRSFFSEFGTIESVTLKDDRSLAIIAFSDHDSAQRAYDSPKVIFDNRFVKVYWYKPDQTNGNNWRGGRGGSASARGDHPAASDTTMAEAEPTPDPAIFAAQQAAAQERFESQRAARTAREELEAKIKAQAEEREALLKRLAAKTGGPKPDAPAAEDPTPQTQALRAKLAALEAEAKSIGLNPDAPEQGQQQQWAPRGRGRGYGGYGYAPRGRGGWRGGRGGAPLGGAVKRLDNRPRALSVTFGEGKWDEQREEALRQFLLFSNQIQHSRLSPHPSRQDAALVAFTERFRAELFLAAVKGKESEIPHVGKVEVAWVPSTEVPAGAFPDTATAQQAGEEEGNVKGTWVDEGMQGLEEQQHGGEMEEGRRGEVDYDVADDDARWEV